VTANAGTTVDGDVGVSTPPGPSIVGFPPATLTGTKHDGDAVAAQAQNDVTPAYVDLAGRACNVTLTGVDLGGRTLTGGVYCYATSAGLTTGGPPILTLDGQGNPDAVFVFKIGSTLTIANNASVILTGGAQAKNVWWQVGSSATLGTNSVFQGNIIAQASITLNTGANITGRALARTGAVTLDATVAARP
jgi:type VI secretion system secreted protein VgrG